MLRLTGNKTCSFFLLGLFLYTSLGAMRPSTPRLLKEYYAYPGFPDHHDFFYDVLDTSIKNFSFANMHDLIIDHRVPFNHEVLQDYNVLPDAIYYGYHTLANFIITSKIDLNYFNHAELLHKILLHYEKNPNSIGETPKLYTVICLNLIRHGIPLNITTDIVTQTKTLFGVKESVEQRTTLKQILLLLLRTPNNTAKDFFEIITFALLQHGAMPNYDCDLKYFELCRKLSPNLMNSLKITEYFYKENTRPRDLFEKAGKAKLLPFLTTVAFTNNGREFTCNACDVLWCIQDYLATCKKKINVIDCYNAHDACNQKYRNGYNSFKKMYTLYTMYTRRSLSDVQFTWH